MSNNSNNDKNPKTNNLDFEKTTNIDVEITKNIDNSVTNSDNSVTNNTTNNTDNSDNSVTNNTTNNTDNSVINNTDIDNITHITNNHYTVYKTHKITNYFYGSKKKDKFKGTDYKDKIFGNGGKDVYKLSSDGIVDHIHIKRDGVADVARKLSNEDRIHLGGEITLKTTQKGIKVFSNGVLELIYKGNNLTENVLETMII